MKKDNMEKHSSPKLAQAVKESYERMNNKTLADTYWYCYHEDVRVERD